MNLEEFNKLSDDEKTAVLTSYEKTETDFKELGIEAESLRNENNSYKETITKQEEEIKKTKEVNYTLARHVDTSKNKMSFEDALHGLIGKEKK